MLRRSGTTTAYAKFDFCAKKSTWTRIFEPKANRHFYFIIDLFTSGAPTTLETTNVNDDLICDAIDQG